MTKPLNGYAVQMVNRNPKIRPLFVWPKGETPATDSPTDVMGRYSGYCNDVQRLVGTGQGASKIENWQAQSISEVRLVQVVDGAAQGYPLHSRVFAAKQEKSAA